MAIKLPLGNDNFSEIRTNGDYYVDKSLLISKLLSVNSKVTLITRPRRFGKTLTMSMLEDFFDIGRKSEAHFKGLKISENVPLCSEWMNRWPVIFFTLKNVDGLDFQSAYGMLEVLLADICKKYTFLERSEKVDEADKKTFLSLKFQEAEPKALKNCLALLTRMLAMHFGKPVILLLDEYDVPLARATENGFYREMLDVIRALFSALKTNEYLKFAVVTGCLKIAKESIFTGTNNFVADTIAGEFLSRTAAGAHDDE